MWDVGMNPVGGQNLIIFFNFFKVFMYAVKNFDGNMLATFTIQCLEQVKVLSLKKFQTERW